MRVLILTGAGEKSFVAGADIGELAVQTPVSGKETAAFGQGVLHLLETIGKPSIAAINGFALGGGCEVALACSMRLASKTAKLGQPEVKLGIMTGYGGSQRLTRLCGKGVAYELCLTGEMISAEEALRIGLVNHVYEPAELMPAAEALAKKIIANAPLSVKFTMEAIERGMEMPLEEGQYIETTLFGLLRRHRGYAGGHARISRKARRRNFAGSSADSSECHLQDGNGWDHHEQSLQLAYKKAKKFGLIRYSFLHGKTFSRKRNSRSGERAQGLRFALVVSRFNSFITDRLLAGAVDALEAAGADAEKNIVVVHVPGSFEIPLTAKKLAEGGRVDAVIAIGCILRGETAHFDYVASEVARGVQLAQLDTGMPVIFCVLTCDTLEQAIDRAGLKSGNKGYDAGLAAIEMANLSKQLRATGGRCRVPENPLPAGNAAK